MPKIPRPRGRPPKVKRISDQFESKKTQSVSIREPDRPLSMIEVISRAAADPRCDVDKMERLIEMQVRLMAIQAKKEFIEAFIALSPALPVVTKRGLIEIRDKKTGEIIQTTAYAKFEDIDDVIRPILNERGFALSYQSNQAPDGKLVVKVILYHVSGHQEDTTLILPFDISGSKNNVQGVGSSLSYGKRYGTTSILNINSRDQDDADDDGTAAKSNGPDRITEEQAEVIRAEINNEWIKEPMLLSYLGIDKVEDMPASRYEEVMRIVEQRKGKDVRTEK